VHGVKDKIWGNPQDAEKNTFRIFSVEQVAEQISYMPKVQLKAIDGFYIAPIFQALSKKGLHAVGQYTPGLNIIYLYADGKSKFPDQVLASILLHEGGHALDDRWYQVSDRFFKLHMEEENGAVEKSKARLDELTQKIDAECRKPFLLDLGIQKRHLEMEKYAEQMNCSALESLHKEQMDKLQKAYDQAFEARKQWEEAIKADKYWRVSTYSKEGGPTDDFAEHCAAYILAYGSECEALMRKHMHRWLLGAQSMRWLIY
jgi:hypothetical protein